MCEKQTEDRPSHDRVVACYVSTWARYRTDRGQFTIDDIDPSLCTHLIYAFAGLDNTTSSIKSLDPYNDLEENYGLGSYKKMAALRKKYPHLTVSVAIGGWNEGSVNYSVLAADADRRKLFVESVVNFMRTHGFNGFDLDWEFPAKRGGAPEDKENFVALVKELHTSLKPEGWSLTAALGAGKDTMEVAYDLSQLNQYLDHIHLMCYDYHGKWDSQTGANAPLHSADPNDVNTVEYSVKYMLEHGIEPHKLVLGLPMYGRTFIHKDELVSEKLGTPSMSTAFSGPYTKEDGFMGYNEICEELQNNTSWKRLWDESSLTPFAVNGNKVIVYDDEESLKYKVKYAMEKDLGGLMIWSIDIDDFRGDCVAQDGEKKEKFQLLRSVNEAIVSSLREIDVEKEKEKEKSQTEQTTEQTTNEPVTPSKATVLSTSSILISVLLFLPCFFYRTITLMS
ncbi:probable chitinase 2 isoform X2 [Homalodisca vitripennis]|uniref:probable chitinase 2 isoform X2 n=1 Tax=Homalodisca vitripennis TaxID=197043 RepID=UPI001EEC1550|nr:probable chitinase 2 isoform X2 [Homalodisca vitripennis]